MKEVGDSEAEALNKKDSGLQENIVSLKDMPDGVLPLTLSIVGLIVFQPLCIVSLIFSLKDKKTYTQAGLSPAGTITAALIISIIGISLLLIGIVLLIVFLLLFLPGFIDGASSA